MHDSEFLWYTKDKEAAGPAVVQTVLAIARNDGWRRANYAAYADLYGQVERIDLGTNKGWYSQDRELRVTDNVVKSVIDTIATDVTKSKPFPLPLTSGGNWSLKRKAKLFKKYLEGLFLEADPYRDTRRAQRDSLIFGTGFVAVINDCGRVRFERVLPWEIFVDPIDAMYGRPRCLYRAKQIDRNKAKAMFPDAAEELFANDGEGPFGQAARSSDSAPAHDTLWIYEAWRLPDMLSAEESPDEESAEQKKRAGTHIIASENGTLLCDDWDYDWFPIVDLTCDEPIAGLWGVGVAEELSGTQIEIESVLGFMQMTRRVFSVPTMYIENMPDSADIPDAVFSNQIGKVVRLPAGAKIPQVVAPSVIQPELFTYKNELVQSCYQRYGLNQLSSGGSIPAGVQSGRAIQAYVDKGSTRLGGFHDQWEQLHVRLGRIALAICKEIHEERKERGEGGYSVSVSDGKYLDRIDWEDISLNDDQYTLQVFPVNFLSNDPVARLDQIESLLQMGAIDTDKAKALLDFPDLDASMRLDTAWWDEILWIIEEITEHGRYVPPESEMNLEKAVPMIQFARTRARLDGVPEERISLLSRWLVSAADLMGALDPAQGVPAPMPVAAEGAPDMGAPLPGVPTPPSPIEGIV